MVCAEIRNPLFVWKDVWKRIPPLAFLQPSPCRDAETPPHDPELGQASHGNWEDVCCQFLVYEKKKKRQKLHTFFLPSSRLNPALLQLCKPEPIRAAPTVLVHGGGSSIFLPGVLPPSGTDIVPPSNISSLIKMMSLSKSSHLAYDVVNNIETKRGLISSSHMAKQQRLPRALPTKLKYEPIKMLAKGKPLPHSFFTGGIYLPAGQSCWGISAWDRAAGVGRAGCIWHA